MGKEYAFHAYGVGLDGNLFEGKITGDIEKPVQTWFFEINTDIHPYLIERKGTGNFLQIKDIWVDLSRQEEVEGV